MILSGPISPNLVSHIAKLRNRKERKRKLIAGLCVVRWADRHKGDLPGSAKKMLERPNILFITHNKLI